MDATSGRPPGTNVGGDMIRTEPGGPGGIARTLTIALAFTSCGEPASEAGAPRNTALLEPGVDTTTAVTVEGLVALPSSVITLTAVDSICTPPPTGMLHWWTGDDTPDDYVGTAHGTLVGGTSFFGPGKVLTAGGIAFDFDGADELVQVSHTASLNPSGSFTLDAWAKLLALTPNNGAVAGKGGPLDENYVIDHLGDRWRAFIRENGGSAVALLGPTVDLNEWTHLALTWDGSTMSFYVNGSLAADTAVSITVNNSAEFFGIGARSEAGFDDDDLDLEFAGLVEEVEFFSRALSGSEIAAIVDAGNKGKCKGICDDIFTASTGDARLDDPVVQEALVTALVLSEWTNANTELRLEHGGYIYERTDGTRYVRFTPDPLGQTGCSVKPGPPLEEAPSDTAVAVLHTHPFSHNDVLPQNCGAPKAGSPYNAQIYGGGSLEDWSFANSNGVPVYIIDLDQVYRLDHGTTSNWGANQHIWLWDPTICGL